MDGGRDRNSGIERGESRGWLDMLANALIRKGRGVRRRKGGKEVQER